jgi:signal transduction histidine kinase
MPSPEREASAEAEDLPGKSAASQAEALERASAALREATARIVELEEEAAGAAGREHKKVGAFLHDHIGQLLTGIGYLAQSLEQRLREREAPERRMAEEIRGLAVQVISETRTLSRGLFSGGIQNHGLGYALAELADFVKKTHGINCRFSETESLPDFSPTVVLHLYRIAQEGINNAIKHGDASEIHVSLEASGDNGILRIYNNGTDCVGKSDHDGIGLIIMNQRASQIGGVIAIHSGERGVELSCRFPSNRECSAV